MTEREIEYFLTRDGHRAFVSGASRVKTHYAALTSLLSQESVYCWQSLEVYQATDGAASLVTGHCVELPVANYN